MPDFAITLSPEAQRALAWKATQRNVEPTALIHSAVEAQADVIIRERRDLAGAKMLDAYDALSADDKVTVRTLLGLSADEY